MIVTNVPGGRAATQTAADLARQWARRAVLGIVSPPGGQAATAVTGLAARPTFGDEPAPGPGAADGGPLSGLAAATQLKYAVRRLIAEYARLAREEGRSWRDIGIALGLKDIPDAGVDVADAAYEHLAGTPSSWRPALAWVCRACRNTVIDHGPQAGHPADSENGHADACPRLAAAVAAWHAAHDDGRGQP